MTATTITSVQAHAIDAEVLDRMRTAGVDDFDNPFTPYTADGGEPLRCCLQHAERGEEITLISCSPHNRPSVWAESGPVFVHPAACPGWDPTNGLPADLRVGPRVLRSYRADGSMNYDAIETVAPGVDLELVLARLLARDDVVEVHVRAAEPQCFTYAVLVSEV